jgi:hypothetical protein
MKIEFSRRIFRKIVKFQENPSSGSRLVPCGQTDMKKLIFAFRNFAKAPKNCSSVVDLKFKILFPILFYIICWNCYLKRMGL